MYYVYILRSIKDDSFYIGSTSNLKERIFRHNRKQSMYTSSKTPYKLVWYSAFIDKIKSIKFEKYLKSSSGFAFRNKHLI